MCLSNPQIERLPEQFAHALFLSPVERTRGWRRLDEWRHHPEHRAESSFRSPVSQAEAPAALQHARELPRRRRVVGRKHDPACRGHDVEGAILDSVELLAIAHAIIDLEPFRLRACLRLFQQRGSEIKTRHLRARARRSFRHRAGSTGKIEPAFSRSRLQRLHHPFMNIRDRFRDPLIRSRPPHHALALLQFFVSHIASVPSEPTGCNCDVCTRRSDPQQRG